MPFFKRERKKDIDEIKQAVSAEPISEFTPPPPIERKEEFAPMFVKVEKYKDVLSTVQEIKIFISGVKQLFAVINDLEALRSDSLKILRATIGRMEKSLVEIDHELLRPRGFEIEFPHGEIEIRHIEDSLTDLQNQLASLRRELETLKE